MQIVSALMAAARAAVTSTLGERAEVVWPMLEGEARTAAEESARELAAILEASAAEDAGSLQARDWAAEKREKAERKARAIASATKESMSDPEYLRAFQEAMLSTDSLKARELYEAASYAKVTPDAAIEAVRNAAIVSYYERLPIPSRAIRWDSTKVDIVRAAKWFSDKRLKGAEKRREEKEIRKRAEEKYGAFYTDALRNLAAAKKAHADHYKILGKRGQYQKNLAARVRREVEYAEKRVSLMESGKYEVPEDALVEARQRLARERASEKKA